MRVPTNIVSTICDDRGEEPTYNGVTMSELIEGDYIVGDVISLLWFKRQLPKYATRFVEMCIMLCADHGPCVSGVPSDPLFPSKSSVFRCCGTDAFAHVFNSFFHTSLMTSCGASLFGHS